MKKYFLLIIFISCVSCTIPYDAETRLVFETKLVDSNDNSLEGIDVEITVSNGSGFGSSSEILSFGKTNSNGELRLIFPSPEFDRGYDLSVNSPYSDNENYVPFEINNIGIENFNGYKLTIPKIYRLTYDESVQVYLEFNSINNSNKITNVFIDGINSPYSSSFLDEEETFYIYNFFAKKNQTIQINYTVKNISGQLQNISQELVINEENISQIINY
ncbi:hypothetical protein WFZ85_12045 [Flavobacterium sp. j3]|uniref:Lipoprotein n=1 Tax=Flavobacterium aureirubrum TaxID=3133147 RepID=A0ABU9N9W3_9FLAO